MPDGSFQGGPVQGYQAVKQIKPTALRRHQAGGKATANGEPTQTDGEQKLHQHGHPERRQGIGAKAVEASGEIKLALRACDAAEADAEAHDSRHDESDDTQLKAGREGSADDAADWLLVDQALSKIALNKAMQVVEVLLHKRLVEAEAGAHRCLRCRRSTTPKHGIHRVPWGNPQQQEDQRRDQPEHHRCQAKPRGAVTQQRSSACHQGNLLSCDRIRCPLPSKRGRSRLGWLQARGASSHTGM